MAGLDFLMGGQGDDADAQRLGLLSAGLGILANNSGHYGAAGPALAAGAMNGIQGYQGALDQQAQNRAAAFKQQQQEATLRAAQAKQSYVAALASGQKQFNPNEALANGFTIDEIKGMADFGNFGKAKVKDYREIRLPDGRVVSQGFDEYGQAVGEGQTPYKAPLQVDRGGVIDFMDPLSLKTQASTGKTMTPGEIASNAVARANLGISQQRLLLDKANTGGFSNNPMIKGAPSGYRWNLNGELEAIPGGPAALEAIKGKAPTEFQAKSATFGARAERADKILGDLQDKYAPGAVAAKQGAENVYGIGGVLGAIGNTVLPENAQMADQAQRDFVNAVLRQESGASISDAEFANAKRQYFPQPGDSKAVIKQKADNRAVAIQGFKNSAGNAAFTAKPANPTNGGWSAKKVN